MASPGAAILLWQVYAYARTGTWTSLSTVDGLVRMGSRWAAWPHDWVGLHRASVTYRQFSSSS